MFSWKRSEDNRILCDVFDFDKELTLYIIMILMGY